MEHKNKVTTKKRVQNNRKENKNELFFDAHNLNDAIKLKGYTKKAIADKTYINYRTICYYCNGSRKPTERDAQALSALLEVAPEYIKGESNHPEGGLSGWIKDLNDRQKEKYQKTILFLKDIGIDIQWDQEYVYLKMKDQDPAYIDYSMLWFILDSIQSSALGICNAYVQNGVSITGAKGLSDIKPDAFSSFTSYQD